jgi:hypothetical protein
VEEAKEWFCYMCRDLGCVGLLKKQEDWGANLHLLYSTGFEQEYVMSIYLCTCGLFSSLTVVLPCPRNLLDRMLQSLLKTGKL